MSVRVPWNAGVTQTDNEPVSLTTSDHKGLVGNPAVSSNPLQSITKGLRRCHYVIKQPDFARIEIASQREAKTVILRSNRCLVQKCDLASDTQSFFRVGDHLGRQSHTSKKRLHWYSGALEARDNQAGKAALRCRDRSQILFGIQDLRGPIGHV